MQIELFEAALDALDDSGDLVNCALEVTLGHPNTTELSIVATLFPPDLAERTRSSSGMAWLLLGKDIGSGATPQAAACIRGAPGARHQDRDLISSMSFHDLACTMPTLFVAK